MGVHLSDYPGNNWAFLVEDDGELVGGVECGPGGWVAVLAAPLPWRTDPMPLPDAIAWCVNEWACK